METRKTVPILLFSLLAATAVGQNEGMPGTQGLSNNASVSGKMYWGGRTNGTILRANLDGTNIQTLVTGLTDPRQVAIDAGAGKMYWTSWAGRKIQRANLDGSVVQDVLTGLPGSPQALDLDVAGGKMYWTESTFRIKRANLDGTSVQTLISGLNFVTGIALDASAGKMYFLNQNANIRTEVRRANLDGTVPEILVTLTTVSGGGSIALDPSAGKMYWVDQAADTLRRANMADGSALELLLTLSPPSATPTGIALDLGAGLLYWTDLSQGKIGRANLNGTSPVNLITGLTQPVGITLDLTGGPVCGDGICDAPNEDNCTCPADCPGSGLENTPALCTDNLDNNCDGFMDCLDQNCLGVVCKTARGICDVAETCNGASTACPVDSFQPSTTQCRAAPDVCDVAEFCTGGAADCPSDGFAPPGAPCRTSAGICDVAETCNGASPLCPVDSFQPSTTQCRAAPDVCDVAEFCTGGSAACPSDGFAPPGAPCRTSAGICDVTETCNGASPLCPADSFQPSTTQCRAAPDVCDVAEFCTGGSAACPIDGFASTTTACRTSAGICDVTETCNGASPLCPVDSFQPSTTQCRAAPGVCDVAEFCTGGSAACPSDGFAPPGAACRTSAGICDVTETCNGASPLCPADSFQPSTTQCRAAPAVCDVAEFCTGGSAVCPIDGFASTTTVCRTSAGTCDLAESCTGLSAGCPADSFLPVGAVCDDGDACTVGDACTATHACAGNPDCLSSSCCLSALCLPMPNEAICCSDGIDNDGDGFVDCLDPDCSGDPCSGCSSPLVAARRTASDPNTSAYELSSSEAAAAVSFTDNFDGPMLNSALEDRDGTYVFSGGSTHNTGGRSYVRTVAGDYLAVDFVAEVTFTINGGSGAGGVFIGLGPADKDTTFFNEPLMSVYMVDHAHDFVINGNPVTPTVIRSNANADGTVWDDFNWPSPVDGTDRVRITKAGDALTFEVDLFFDGNFAPEFSGTVSLAGDLPFLTASNSHLFFGTESATSLFLDMTVLADCNGNGVSDACDIARCDPLFNPSCGDCNGNGIPDGCDIAAGGGADCNSNGVPDRCEISAGSPARGGPFFCPTSAGCDPDCNINGVPDICDDPSDGVPDTCLTVTGGGSFATIPADTHLTLSDASPTGSQPADALLATYILDEDRRELSLAQKANTILKVNANLSFKDVVGSTEASPYILEGALLVDGAFTIGKPDPLAGTKDPDFFIVAPSAVYQKDPQAVATPVTAELFFVNGIIKPGSFATLSNGGIVDLTDGMSLLASGNVTLEGALAFSAPAGDAAAPLGISPPPRFMMRTQVAAAGAGASIPALAVPTAQVAGSFRMTDAVQSVNNSPVGVSVSKDFINEATFPSLFDWTEGRLVMTAVPVLAAGASTAPVPFGDGTPSAPSAPQAIQRFEVAGLDLGPTSEGFLTMQPTLFDINPHTNFAIRKMQIGGTLVAAGGATAGASKPTNVVFENLFANTAGVGPCLEAQYIDELTLENGVQLTLDNVHLYYNRLQDNGASITKIGCGDLVSIICAASPQTPPQAEQIADASGLMVPSVKSRFLSFSGGDPGLSQAVRVTFVSLPGAFSVFDSTSAWVALPFRASEFPGKGLTDPIGGEATFLAAALSPTPVFTDWSTFGVVHVFDERIIPSRKLPGQPTEPAMYDIQLVTEGCDLNTELSFSPPLTISNARWGDLAQLAAGEFRAPDGVVAIDDTLASLAKFASSAGAPIKARAELVGVGANGPQGAIDGKTTVSDLLAVLDAFAGGSYLFPPPAPAQ